MNRWKLAYKKNITYEIIMQENQISHVFRNFPVYERHALTEEDIASCSRTFRKSQNAEEERKLIENGTPKSTIPLKKYSSKNFFWNGRMLVGKQKFSNRALRIHNWQVLSATLGHRYGQLVPLCH